MSKTFDNPCENCCIGQDCCTNLKGLKLTKSEYKQHFARHQDRLVVQQKGLIYEVSAKQGGTCPHWNDGCAIYNDRSIECRLFPYTIKQFRFYHGRVLLTLSDYTNCPLKRMLLLPWNEAQNLASLFARDAFGNECFVKVRYETLTYRLVDKLRKVITRLYKQSNST